MAKFCRGCGTRLEEDARFCGECGAATSSSAAQTAEPSPAAQLSPQALPAVRAGSGRGLIIAAVLGVCVIAGGTSAWWFTRAEPLSEAVFLREAQRTLALNPKQLASQFCVISFVDYRSPEIRLRDNDQRSRQWFDMLAADGLYAPAQQQTLNDTWGNEQILWSYQQTAKGKAALQNGRLCYADQVVINKASFSPPKQIGAYSIAQGVLSYQAKDPAKWSQSETAKNMAPEIERQIHGEFQQNLVLVDRQWQFITPELEQAITQSRRERQHTQTSKSTGWLDQLLSLFTSAPKGVETMYGTWEAESILGQELSIQLDQDAITIMGEKTGHIRYLPRENSDWIRVKNQQEVTLIELRVENENTLEYKFMGMLQGKMHRRS